MPCTLPRRAGVRQPRPARASYNLLSLRCLIQCEVIEKVLNLHGSAKITRRRLPGMLAVRRAARAVFSADSDRGVNLLPGEPPESRPWRAGQYAASGFCGGVLSAVRKAG